MTLSEFIRQYREEHDMSIRAFAAMAGMSPQQISNIEKGVGNNGKPMTSTMSTYKKIADAVGMSEQDFLNMLNDNVAMAPDDEEEELADVLQLLKDREDLRALLHVSARNTPEQVRRLAQLMESMNEG